VLAMTNGQRNSRLPSLLTPRRATSSRAANSRPELVDLGVELYEMKPYAASRALDIARPATSKAHLALHGKAAVFDRKTVFIGSFNLDPRSMNLDTEIALVVQSPQLAAQFLDAFAVDFAPENAWRIADVVARSDDVAWITPRPARPLVEPHDPASVWRRFVRSSERLLPIRPLALRNSLRKGGGLVDPPGRWPVGTMLLRVRLWSCAI
jgi:cardiolipin synthase C